MSFSIHSYTPGRDDDSVEGGLGPCSRTLPFPTEAWRRMVGGPAATPGQAPLRTPHAAELALEEVERQMERAALSFREALAEDLNGAIDRSHDPDDWRPRAA